MIQDGFMIMYIKDEQAHPVPMSNKEWETLQQVIPTIFGPGTIKVSDEPMGEVVNLAEEDK